MKNHGRLMAVTAGLLPCGRVLRARTRDTPFSVCQFSPASLEAGVVSAVEKEKESLPRKEPGRLLR